MECGVITFTIGEGSMASRSSELSGVWGCGVSGRVQSCEAGVKSRSRSSSRSSGGHLSTDLGGTGPVVGKYL